MKKLAVFMFMAGALLVSCGEKTEETEEVVLVPTIESITEDIAILEDSIMRMSRSEDTYGKQMINLVRQQLHEKLKYGYQNFPEDKNAPGYLAKLHMSYASIGVDEMASRYADTLITNYPEFKDRRQIIESQIIHFSMKKPYESKKVEELVKLILEDENIELSEQQRADYEFRLENIDLTMEQLMELDSPE